MKTNISNKTASILIQLLVIVAFFCLLVFLPWGQIVGGDALMDLEPLSKLKFAWIAVSVTTTFAAMFFAWLRASGSIRRILGKPC